MAILSRSSRRVSVIALIVCLWAGGRGAGAVSAQEPIEANVKAVFLFNFAKYVTWPAIPMRDRSPSGIRICVTADDPFFALLKTAVRDEHVDGKPLEAFALQGLDDARSCQILYVGASHTADARAWFNAVKGHQVLTVGDGAAGDEPVIAFAIDRDRLRFDIDRAAAARHGLSVSAKLLRLARHVRDR